jgi:predicted deacylase
MKENTTSIKSYRLNAGGQGPHLLITAGVHGDEYEPIVAALELVDEIPPILTRGTVTVVPVVNTTAYASRSRFGEDGLDLARICPGKEYGSSSERNAYQVSKLIQEADCLVDLHTGGMAHSIFPMAGFMIHPTHDLLDKQRQLALACNLPVIWGTDPLPNGRTLSIARDAGIPAIYLEYGGGSGFRREVVTGYKDAVINILKLLKQAKGPIGTLMPEGRYWVEDSRPDSGYFQGKMPAPVEGIFVSEVEPGMQIKKGQVFGKIINPITGRRENIVADQDGLVLSVRVSVYVKKGEALGSIIPLNQPGKVFIK